jgi:hypothetical protein
MILGGIQTVGHKSIERGVICLGIATFYLSLDALISIISRQFLLISFSFTFHRRNFKAELESKLIKLIFNGKLLEDDSKSIQQCGIFSEATVHCLIVQKKNISINASSTNQNIANGSNRTGASDTNNSLINNFNIAGIFLVTLTLIFCWYCRVQYASYFSWYSTIGLILMTSLFIILIPLFSMVFS